MGLIKKFADFAGVKHDIDPTGHIHSTSESWLSTIVNNLTALINGKAATVHTHTKSQVTDFAHTHAQSDVTGLNADLAEKAASVHMHTFTDVAKNGTTLDATISGIDTALAGKADSDHAHTSIEAGEVDITCQQTTSGGKVVITIGDNNIQLIGDDLVKLRTLLDS